MDGRTQRLTEDGIIMACAQHKAAHGVSHSIAHAHMPRHMRGERRAGDSHAVRYVMHYAWGFPGPSRRVNDKVQYISPEAVVTISLSDMTHES